MQMLVFSMFNYATSRWDSCPLIYNDWQRVNMFFMFLLKCWISSVPKAEHQAVSSDKLCWSEACLPDIRGEVPRKTSHPRNWLLNTQQICCPPVEMMLILEAASVDFVLCINVISYMRSKGSHLLTEGKSISNPTFRFLHYLTEIRLYCTVLKKLGLDCIACHFQSYILK